MAGAETLKQFGGYLLEKQIWQGLQATVYLAHNAAGEAVALKIFYPQPGRDRVAQRLAAKLESHRLVELTHPNIISLRDFGEVNGAPYLCFPLIEGRRLDQVLGQSDVSLKILLDMVEKTCRAVHYAHTRGIIHRDLKPRNILLDLNDQPFVIDWGASWKQGDKAEPGMQHIVGTAAYISPEQARGEEEGLTPASDIYSLGAILYHLLTGRPPFEGSTPWKTMQMTMSLPPKPPRELTTTVDLRMERIILWCLEKQPDKRYSSAAALADDLLRAGEQGNPKGPAGILTRLFTPR